MQIKTQQQQPQINQPNQNSPQPSQAENLPNGSEVNQLDAFTSINDDFLDVKTENDGENILAQPENADFANDVEDLEPELLTQEQFYAGFSGAFNITSELTSLSSLEVSNDDGSRQCSNAIYAYATEIPQLRWLIAPENVHVQRAFAILPFAFLKYKMVKMELAERRAERESLEKAEKKAETNADNTPPPTTENIRPQAEIQGGDSFQQF